MPSDLSKNFFIKSVRPYQTANLLLFIFLLFVSLTLFAVETNSQSSENNLPTCREYFPNLDYISALKQKLEKDFDKGTFYPASQPMYEIIWYEPGNIKAIIELNSQKEWNGSIHSWYKSRAYLGCAGLENGQHRGISIAYHENGKIRAIANFVDGIPIGLEHQFSTTGQLSSSKNHDENSPNNSVIEKFGH